MIIEAAEAEMNYGSNPQMRLQIRRPAKKSQEEISR